MSHLLLRPPISRLSHLPTASARCLHTTPRLNKLNPMKIKPAKRPDHNRGPQGPSPTPSITMSNMNSRVPDIGMMPGTYIPPVISNLPSPLTSPKRLLITQWYRLRQSLHGLFSILVYKAQSPKRPRPKLQARQIVPTAKKLHQEMYKAVASGDTAKIVDICSEGLRDGLTARVASRSANERVEWELVKYMGWSRCVSHRYTMLTASRDGLGMRQAVVRLKSRQRLTRYSNGKKVEGSGVEKDMVEYLVLHKTTIDHVEGKWTLWGTTTETSWDTIEKEREKARNP